MIVFSDFIHKLCVSEAPNSELKFARQDGVASDPGDTLLYRRLQPRDSVHEEGPGVHGLHQRVLYRRKCWVPAEPACLVRMSAPFTCDHNLFLYLFSQSERVDMPPESQTSSLANAGWKKKRIRNFEIEDVRALLNNWLLFH